MTISTEITTANIGRLTRNEENLHGLFPLCGALSVGVGVCIGTIFGLTCIPGRTSPLIMTLSPVCRPLLIIRQPSTTEPSVTGLNSTVLLNQEPEQNYCPDLYPPPDHSIRMVDCLFPVVSLTLANIPGANSPESLVIDALTRSVPVRWSI